MQIKDKYSIFEGHLAVAKVIYYMYMPTILDTIRSKLILMSLEVEGDHAHHFKIDK